MKRIALIAVLVPVLICGAGIMGTLAYLQLTSIKSTYLPVPPNAQNVQRGEILQEYARGGSFMAAPGAPPPGQPVPGTPTLQFDTADSPEVVRSFYDSWLSADNWTPLSTGDPYIRLDGAPDLLHARIETSPGSVLPNFHLYVPKRYYATSISVSNTFNVGGINYITVYVYLTAMSM